MEEIPLNVFDKFWLCFTNDYQNVINSNNIGKWMLFYPKENLNESWLLIKNLYIENKLNGIISIKVSTSKINSRSSSSNEGVIILYCNNSFEEDRIINIGDKLLETINYKYRQIIYYKSDEQTQIGTAATGISKNYLYRVYIKPKRLLR